MTYYERPDRLKIYRNTRARYPLWPARHALYFANECMAYRLLLPDATRPAARVKYHTTLTRTRTASGLVKLAAPEAPCNPWGKEYETEYLYGTWRCYRFTNREDGVRLLATSEQGYYCDMWQDRLAKGIVVGLPAKDGLTKLLVGYQYTDNTLRDCDDGYVQLRVDSWVTSPGNECEGGPSSYELETALRAADEHARRVSEEDREYAVKDEAERQIDEKKDEICELFKSRHTEGIEWAREQIAELRERIRALTDEPWIIEYGY